MKAPLQAPVQEDQTRRSDALQRAPDRQAMRDMGFVDNRPAAVAQRKLQEMISNNPHVLQPKAFVEMINNSSRVLQQKAQMDAIQNSPRTVAQRQKMDALFGGAVQRQEDEASYDRLKSAPAQLAQTSAAKSNNTGLPDQLKFGIESISGMSMDHVKVHYNSSQPAQLNAHAYAQGAQIYLANGQERHLPHEAWHVVQQAQGRVRPTMQMKDGTAINDSRSLEREADVTGAKAMSLKLDASRLHNSGDQGYVQTKPISFGFSDNNIVLGKKNYSNYKKEILDGSLDRRSNVIQKIGISTFTRLLPYISEKLKERFDPRRWTRNPYWNRYNHEESEFEANHGGAHLAGGAYIAAQPGGYHSRERHGAEHSFQNVHARTQAGGAALAVNGPSSMTHLGVPVNGFVGMPSGRFATAAWHTYSRNKAKEHVANSFPGVIWPDTAAPKLAAAVRQNFQFTIEYEDTPAGVSINAAQNIARAHFVRSTILRNTGTNHAWFKQHFPQTAAAPGGGAVPNLVVPYNQIPWFSVN